MGDELERHATTYASYYSGAGAKSNRCEDDGEGANRLRRQEMCDPKEGRRNAMKGTVDPRCALTANI